VSARPNDVASSGADAGPSRRHAVFISDFVHIERPFHEVAARMLQTDAPWYRAADRSAARQRFSVTTGDARQNASNVIVPLRWEPVAFERLLPTLDADLELSSLGGDHCRLSFSGRYQVPLAQFGAGLDRVAMHRVAETAVRRFLLDIAEVLESNASDSR
jgi:hypothetical protein